VGVYQIYRSNSIVDNSQEIYLSLAFKDGTPPRREILSIELTCTNNHVPENLRIGDICEATSHSPELADFRNVIAPTPQIDMVSGNNLIWRFLSHVSLNYLPCASAESLRELLRLYIFEQQRSDQRVGANIKRVEAISGFTSRPVERLVRGAMMRGVKLQLTAAAQNFASTGDLYLFASVLDRFMALYVSINTFSQFELINSQSGEVFQWKPRLGEKPLL
jgi:type VI secretion system protein ImpG